MRWVRRLCRSGQTGFTLTEIVTALAITAILAGATAPMVMRSIQQAQSQATRTRLERLGEGLVSFYRDQGRFPGDAEGLNALLSDPGLSSWKGPYVVISGSPAATLEDSRRGSIAYSSGALTATPTPANFPDLVTTVNASEVIQEWIGLAQGEIARLNDVAEDYRITNGAYPAAVSALVPTILGDDFRYDPWGSDYQVNGVTYTFFSRGPDGTAGGGDDIFAPGL